MDFNVLFSESENFDVQLGETTAIADNPYTGEYDVTPKTYEIVTLKTERKTLSRDVTIQKIPQFLVSNDEGGKTLIIGEEYYG